LKLSLNKKELIEFAVRQVNNLIPDSNPVNTKEIGAAFDRALERTEFCFSGIKSKYYFENGETVFNHLNSDHSCIFLYYLSNSVYRDFKNEEIAAKFFLLNKYLNGIDVFYSVELPDVFMVVHPLGTILGKAKYKNYLIAYQNVTVGATDEGIYPELGEGVILYSKTSVIGNCRIGNNVIFGSNSYIVNKNIGDNTIVLGNYPNNILKQNDLEVLKNIFKL
jgi:serine O-acetyltransferase